MAAADRSMSNRTQARDPVNRRRVLQILGSASVVGIAGCAGDEGQDTTTTTTTDDGNNTTTPGSGAQQGGTLNMSQVKSPIEFDPIVLNDVPSAQVAQQIFEGLYTYDAGTGVIPELAASQPEVSNNGQRYTITLQSGATFSNGDAVTAEDVKYSFEAPVDEATENASELNMIDTISIPDSSTVQFDLLYPYGPFMHALTWPIVPMAVRESDKDAFNTASPVGSGQFVFDSWQEGNFALVTRNENYWGEPMANLDGIRFTPVEEATTRVTTLQNQQNDVIEEIAPQLYPIVDSIQGAHIDEIPGIGYFYLAFNCNEGPTADIRVREAIDYCFDMDQAVANYVEPTGVRQYSPLPRSMAETWEMPLEEWEQIPHDKDIAQAQSLFDEAGVPSDYSWRIIVPPDDKREQIGITVGNGLTEAGFSDVTVQRLDWGAFLDLYISGDENDYNMYTLGWAGTPDPDAFTYFLFGRDENTLGVTNGSFYGNNNQRGEDAADMIQQARESSDFDTRQGLYEDAITMILEDRAHLPAYNLKNSFGVRDYVKDFSSHAVESFHITTEHNNVWLDE